MGTRCFYSRPFSRWLEGWWLYETLLSAAPPPPPPRQNAALFGRFACVCCCRAYLLAGNWTGSEWQIKPTAEQPQKRQGIPCECVRAKLNLLRITTTNLYQWTRAILQPTNNKKKLSSFISLEANYFRIISRYPPRRDGSCQRAKRRIKRHMSRAVSSLLFLL